MKFSKLLEFLKNISLRVKIAKKFGNMGTFLKKLVFMRVCGTFILGTFWEHNGNIH